MTSFLPAHDELQTIVANSLQDSQVQKIETVQELWSGYGEIARYYSPALKKPFILKAINLTQQGQHPRGWQGEISHQRKLSSYLNEHAFYLKFARFSNSLCVVPKTVKAGANKDYIWLIMEDLDDAGFEDRFAKGNVQVARLCLKWLANFHACFLQRDISELCPVGSYWHLSTRPQEWQKMPASPLKEHAEDIDKTLNQAEFQTLLQGDAKLANFCFSPNLEKVAAVDFQYTGRGVGIKDVVYFLGACFNNAELFKFADLLLDEYFQYLFTASALEKMLNNAEMHCLEQEWRKLYSFAWADFERFLVGWAPEHKKLNEYSQQQTEKALNELKLHSHTNF